MAAALPFFQTTQIIFALLGVTVVSTWMFRIRHQKKSKEEPDEEGDEDQQELPLPAGLPLLGETLPPPVPAPVPSQAPDIFLSHSGCQKGFARDLYSRLCLEGHSVFFDQNVDSLPPGKPFPPRIFSIAANCKVALIVLSDDFLSSKWPMIELCAFFDRLLSQSNICDSSFTILPLFYKLSPAHIKEERNVTKWREIWKQFESGGHIDAGKCEEIVTKTLPSLNGVVLRPESEQGEASYIEDIINRISSILRPHNHLRFRYGVNPDKLYVGKERLLQVIVDKFRKLEKDEKPCSDIIFLGMYGVPGSGKSTICYFMIEFMFDALRGNAIHLTLPTYLTPNDAYALEVKEQYVNLLSVLIPSKKSEFPRMNLEELYNQLYSAGACFSKKMFLVLDNISPSNYESYKVMIQIILSSNVLGHGSRVMVVAKSREILENFLMEYKHMYNHSITEVPSLTEEEAKQLVRNQFPSIKDDGGDSRSGDAAATNEFADLGLPRTDPKVVPGI